MNITGGGARESRAQDILIPELDHLKTRTMPQYQPLWKLVAVFMMSVVWSSLVVMRVLLGMVKSGLGPATFFAAVKTRERTSVLDDPDFGNHGYVTLKALKIHYVANGEDGRPLVLFIHGFPQFWYSWRHQLKEFGKDYRAVAIDMRGYGESDKPKGLSDYHMTKLTDDVKDVIEALGYDKATVVGHDWGGAIAWSFSMQYPEMVERLVVCNCPPMPVLEKHIWSSVRQMLKSWYMMYFRMPWLPELVIGSLDLRFFKQVLGRAKRGTYSDLDLEAYKYTFGKPGCLTPPLNYYRATLTYRLPQMLRQVSSPTLLIWGMKDTAFDSASLIEKTRDCCPHLRLERIEGASHWVPEEEPTIVNDFIRGFLDTKKAD